MGACFGAKEPIEMFQTVGPSTVDSTAFRQLFHRISEYCGEEMAILQGTMDQEWSVEYREASLIKRLSVSLPHVCLLSRTFRSQTLTTTWAAQAHMQQTVPETRWLHCLARDAAVGILTPWLSPRQHSTRLTSKTEWMLLGKNG